MLDPFGDESEKAGEGLPKIIEKIEGASQENEKRCENHQIEGN